MPSLIDLVDETTIVPIRGQGFPVRGLSALDIAQILQEFPEVRRMLTQVDLKADIVASLIERSPQLVGMIIAAGLEKSGDGPTIDAACRLYVGEQYDLLQAVIGMTFPRGVKSFLDGVSALVSQADARGKAPVTKSPETSNAA